MLSDERPARARFAAPFAFGGNQREAPPYGGYGSSFEPPGSRDNFPGLRAELGALGLRGRGASGEVGFPRDRGYAGGRGLQPELADALRAPPYLRGRRGALYDRFNGPDPRMQMVRDVEPRLNSPRRPSMASLLDEYYGHGPRGHRCRDGCYRCDPDCDHDRHDRGQYHDCLHHRRSCGCDHDDGKAKKEPAVQTKDVTVRGKSYKIRKTFLADQSKFEKELVNFVGKKSEDEVPERVVQLLIDFINEESCDAHTLLELVGVNILASNLGAKSAVEYTLAELQKFDYERSVRGDELTKICGTITMSGNVDAGLEAWLKKLFNNIDGYTILSRSQSFAILLISHPEVKTRLELLLGIRDSDTDLGLMVM